MTRRIHRLPLVAAILIFLLATTGSSAIASVLAPGEASPRWLSPSGTVTVVSAYRAPADRYAAGHRGIDLARAVDAQVVAPASGVVALVGSIAGRGVLTIDHGEGWVSTIEPIAADVRRGQKVARGEPVGTVARGGHAAEDVLHLGVRLHGEYVNPLLMLDEVPRAVLLPCC